MVFAKAVAPILQRFVLGGLEVTISKTDLQRLATLQGQRMLLLPNHPTEDDPYVPLALSKALRENFHYVAAREAFDWNGGLRGKVFQWLGAYSVIRGAADRDSFQMTKSILMEGHRRLVIFIEGEVSNENDTLIPFEAGVIQLAFKAQEALCKQAEVEAPVYVAPLAIKYFYRPGAERAIEKGLVQLEKEMGFPPAIGCDWYPRILTIGQKILAVQEARLNITYPEPMSINHRLEAIKAKLLSKMEFFLDLTPPSESPFLDRVRVVRNCIDKLIYTYQQPSTLSAYERRMLEHLRLEFREFYQELERVVNLLVLHEGYIPEKPTIERFMDVLHRLEREVYGEPKTHAPRVACIQVGTIHNLLEAYPVYAQAKKQTAQNLAHQLETEMAQILQQMSSPLRGKNNLQEDYYLIK